MKLLKRLLIFPIVMITTIIFSIVWVIFGTCKFLDVLIDLGSKLPDWADR